MQKHVTNVAEFLNNNFPTSTVKKLLTRHSRKLSVYFKVRSQRHLVKPERNITWHVRVNGQISSGISTGIKILPEQWNSKKQEIKGYSRLVVEQNQMLLKIKNDLFSLYNDLTYQGVKVTAKMLKELYVCPNPLSHSLVYAYQKFIEYHSLSIIRTTQNKFKYRLNVTKNYLTNTKQTNITISDIDAKWALDFHRHLIYERKVSLDRARSIVGSIAQVLDYCIVQGDLEFNPLRSLKLPRDKQKPIKFLNEDEMAQLQNCPFYDDRLSRVVDCFFVQCFTGMSYGELINFNPREHLRTEKDGQQWIAIRRGKTKTLSLIPVIEQAKELLEKYNYRLPIISNQKMNDYIKEAGQLAGLERYQELQTHMARRTAGTFFLNRGLSIETVSKVLGHRSIKVTQMYYAELLTDTIKQNFKNSGLL